MQVFVLQAQGLGDDENAYESIGVYSTFANAENALHNFVSDMYDEGLTDVNTKIEPFEMDA
jgi:hypothetical protein